MSGLPKVNKHKTLVTIQNGYQLVGKLFKEGEISANGTSVMPGATVRLAGTSMFLDHTYPEAQSYEEIGKIKSIKRLDDGTWIAEFEIFPENIYKKLVNGELALSVSWVSENYSITDGVMYFTDIAIYEVSVVENPAFDTCAAESINQLTCMNAQKHCGCGKPIRPSESTFNTMQKHQEEDRLLMIEEAIETLKESVETLMQKYDELAARIDAMATGQSQAITQEDVQNAIAEAEKRLGEIVNQNNARLDTLADHLINLLETIKKL